MINTNYEPLTELINYLELKEKILKPKPMKTVMQELIEYIEYNEIVYNKDLILKLKELLEKEKEQIIEAHINGQSDFDMLEYREINKILSENYYKKNYAE